ncbi:MAG: YidH family protein [Polyangia bacterium]
MPADGHGPTANEMAEVRTSLAGERTLMSWIRTALGMISFGFSIHKFMAALPGNPSQSTHRLGIALTAMGTAALMAGTIQYMQMLRSLDHRRPGFTFYFACLGIGLGSLLFAGIALRLGPFT